MQRVTSRVRRDEPPKRRCRARGSVRLMTIEHLDGRTRAAHHVRLLRDNLESDLSGGADLTTGQRQLIQRAAVLGALIEHTEAKWSIGEPIEINEYLAAINAQRRVLATLGLERRSRDVSPSLPSYLAGMARRDSETATGKSDDGGEA